MNANVFILGLTILLLLPLPFSKPENGDTISVKLPSVYNGDEPHYLLMMSSITHDFDLDLKNNYLAVHKGSAQAGARFAGKSLVHHTFWYINNRYYSWWDDHGVCGVVWEYNDSGILLPRMKDTVLAREIAELPEYGTHPPGLAFILAPALFPLRNSAMFEPMAIVYIAVIMVLAMLFFRYLLGAYTGDTRQRNMATAIVFLGSPLWYYGRTLFCEGPMAFCAIAAYGLYIIDKKTFFPGLLIAIGMLLKPVFGILAVPLFVHMFLYRNVGGSIRFVLALCLGIGVIFFLNHRMCGSIMNGSQLFILGNTFSGAWGLLTDTRQGLFLICPMTIIALILWPAFLRTYGYKAWLPASGFLLYFIIMATWPNWRGGDSYGPRLIVPVIPFVLLPLLLFLAHIRRYARMKTGIGIFVILISIFINANGVITSWKFISRNPLIAACVKACEWAF
ncbi:MAG: hypothetical protein A2268_02095 [Candidatus Raymondbacteria bacterium RifOxyA12_full_50_37]|uniref:Glycosyltransferase RgtA/B/C/D-like domain-containing protein n=1 Tax=Candidatus Raymondbacteria bacterium RIFOXYD12_FULL_49_13 TaxID=1817890 RepID=A0A1F7F504_UNCRA|nr:MAG: hypothetical protein A2268_02095 [Candidatus Raymondbacteria bacterium RifOxyA12_full_50_37]OGJ91300.1 MAG: hypothetical protein A2350_13240 [Candidatus Raymondbacteria bacterium RifOxyB12_full_50_8]OGJ92219.1 MAG: hypothetical protein A2248_10925 [Candidatus Raymondbacteria bacterium RIFOXYA2_FULL_49_16]OGJ98545.1 MAG: hypothetical protein A2453_06725 [Candidatus Raymondbacteria bacterium RIFOXYC2_FULL_50_21]OGK00020.1 MAG: hypothetical protein A2487_09465 [Candidatus Raymondbacteria b